MIKKTSSAKDFKQVTCVQKKDNEYVFRKTGLQSRSKVGGGFL